MRIIGPIVIVVSLACGSGGPALPDMGAEVAPAGRADRRAFVQLAVYLPGDDPTAADRLQASIAAGSPELVVHRGRPTGADPGVWVDAPPIEQYAPPADLEAFGVGLADGEDRRVAAAPAVVVGTWFADRSELPRVLTSAQQATLALARAAGGWVWDEQSRQLFTADAFDQERLRAGWIDGTPLAAHHVAVHAYDNGGWLRSVTVGMQTFGLPDLVIDGALNRSLAAVGTVQHAVGQGMLQGVPVESGGRFRFDLATSADPDQRELATAARAAGGTGVIDVVLHLAEPEEGDAQNRLWRLDFGEADAADRFASIERSTARWFGPRFEEAPTVAASADDDELARAAVQARSELATLRQAGSLLAPGTSLEVKAPFATVDGSVEWMWVEVHAWDGDVVAGALVNEPNGVPQLHVGSMVQVAAGEVADYVFRGADGTTRGDLSRPILERRSR